MLLIATASPGKKGQYIARIRGRHPKHTFDRQVLTANNGPFSSFEVTHPGLYETCDVTPKGPAPEYWTFLRIEDDLVQFKSPKIDALRIATDLPARQIGDILQGHRADPEAAALAEQLSYWSEVREREPYVETLKFPLPIFSSGTAAYKEGEAVHFHEMMNSIHCHVGALGLQLVILGRDGRFAEDTYTFRGLKPLRRENS